MSPCFYTPHVVWPIWLSMIQESLFTFLSHPCFSNLVNPWPINNKINPSPVTYGLEKKNLPLPAPGFANRVGRSGFLLLWWRSVLFPGPLPLFDIGLVATIVIIDNDKALVNQRNEGYDLTSELQTLEALQNAFILIYCCEIYPYYGYILFTWKSKCSRGSCFYVTIFLGIFLLFS